MHKKKLQKISPAFASITHSFDCFGTEIDWSKVGPRRRCVHFQPKLTAPDRCNSPASTVAWAPVKCQRPKRVSEKVLFVVINGFISTL